MNKEKELLEKMITRSPHIVAPSDLTFLEPQYIVSDEKELVKLSERIGKIGIGLKFDNLYDLRSTTKHVQFFSPDTRLMTLDDCTFTHDEADEITCRIIFPIINASFSGDIESLGHIKEHVMPYGDTKILTPYTKRNAIILLKPVQKKFLYMELHLTKNPFLY
jgi:hypothetical protein